MERDQQGGWRQIKLSEFLTEEETRQAWELFEQEKYGASGRFAARCDTELLGPLRKEIRKRLLVLEDVDTRYLAYMVEYLFLPAIQEQEGK